MPHPVDTDSMQTVAHPTLADPALAAAASAGVSASAQRTRWMRVTLLGILSAATLFGAILLAYELALARVPEHRAALERLVRAHTGLDVRFGELGLRWGWYGPEAVFHRVELGEPGGSNVLLRAPELTVGFDAWRTMRSGQLEAGRVTLVAPEIDFERVGLGSQSAAQASGARSTATRAAAARSGGGRSAAGIPGAANISPANLERARILQRWRGGRIDIEGGTLRLPDPGGSANPLALQIRRASLRRSGKEWSLFALVFLPERLGRTARVVMRLDGDPGRPDAASGSVRLEAQRLLFSGWREVLSAAPDFVRYLPRAGGGDITLNVDFDKGRIVKADGKVRAGGLEFAAADSSAGGVLNLDRLRGEWRLARRAADWRVRVESLELGRIEDQPSTASLTVDAGANGEWIRGTLERAPLESVAAIARWLAPHLELAGVELGGVARDVSFDWSGSRPAGQRLSASARLENVALTPASHAFTLNGMSARVSGTEADLTADVQSHAARLELAQAPQYPLENVRIASRLEISRTDEGWRVTTDTLDMQHEHARLSLDGALEGGGARLQSEIAARGVLSGADVSFVEKVLGAGGMEAFGATASHLTAGRIDKAEFELHGPVGELPFGGNGSAFVGSLTLRDAILSGGDLWPDAEGIDARVEWRGARIRAEIATGHAGPFQFESARAEWDASAERATHVSGRVTGHLEDAIAWVRNHPELNEYAPHVEDFDARGDALFDLDVSIPPLAALEGSQRDQGHEAHDGDSGSGGPRSRAPQIQARVVATFDAAQLLPVRGLYPIESVRGSLAFSAGRLHRSTLTGSWLGGPLTLHVGERREHGMPVLAIQARGLLDARLFAAAAQIDPSAGLEGTTEWSGELAYLPATGSQAGQWRVRADSSLMGITSRLPEPLAKSAGAAAPLHLEVSGTDAAAQLRLNLGDRLRSFLALQRRDDIGWHVERGAVRFGTVAATLPSEPVVLVQGRVSRLDLPAYLAAWQQVRQDPAAPAIRAQLVAGEMLVAGRSYDEVTLQTDRTDAGIELQVESAALAGAARWPVGASAGRPVEVHFTKLSLPERPIPERTLSGRTGSGEGAGAIAGIGAAGAGGAGATADAGAAGSVGVTGPGMSADAAVTAGSTTITASGMTAGAGLLAAFGPAAQLSVDNLVWQGRSLGRLTAKLAARDEGLILDDLRLAGDTHDARGSVRCLASLATCRLSFTLLSSNAATTLEDFGFRPDVSASQASLKGDVEWQARSEQPWLATLSGSLSMRLEDGATRTTAAGGRPFALLAVPALVGGMVPQANEGRPQTAPGPQELRFARLDADFELQNGQASTSNLHFDGDAEILMRGRTGLLAHDYDQQVWVLRGEERLPAAVRRLAPTPSVAAAWLTLRDLFTGNAEDRSRAMLRLQGSWDDPIVAAVN